MGYQKVIHSGSLLEVFTYEKNLPERRKVRSKDSYSKQRYAPRPRHPDSIRRARTSFKRLVRINLSRESNPSLFTFTMHQKLSYGASSRIFTRFIARLGTGRGKRFRYIAVPEFQKRGAVHWHVLIWGLPKFYACQGSWKKKGKYWIFNHECPSGRQCERRTRVISRLWLRGFVDGIATDGSPRLSTYLSKYLSKAMHDQRSLGKKTYHTSHNILRPMHASSSSESIQAILQENVIPDQQPLTEKEYPSEWLGKVVYKQYEISYDRKRTATDDSQGKS